MAPNPLAIPITSHWVGTISAVTNAASMQRATISIDGKQIGIFLGVGEAKEMPLSTGDTTLRIDEAFAPRQCTIFFEHSIDGGATWASTPVGTPVTLTYKGLIAMTVGTEDSTDADWNDTVVVVHLWDPWTAKKDKPDAANDSYL